MRHLERRRRQRALRFVAEFFVTADPVLALVFALVVAAARGNGVALDRLVLEGVAGRGPVAQVAGLEIEVERLAVVADWANSFRGIGGEGGSGEWNQDNDQSETEGGHGGSQGRELGQP